MISWQSLPVEMKLTVVDHLTASELKQVSLISQQTRAVVTPSLFRNVKIDGHDRVLSFLSQVPLRYCAHTRYLQVSFRPGNDMHPSTSQSDLIILLLEQFSMLRQLTLHLFGSPSKDVIPAFTKLLNLSSLYIGNIAPESMMPLSERCVVSIAASVPSLQELTLEGIARSVVHAPELLSIYPYVPLVIGDEDIDDHPVMGHNLSLPSLLRIPTLRKLQLLETHLGDRLWASTQPSCSLEFLDVGSCGYETQEYNSMCSERILRNIATHCPIRTLCVHTSLGDSAFSNYETSPLKGLRQIHLMPLLPTSQALQTLLALSGSPIEKISVECYEEDAVEMCYVLEEFLYLRLQAGGQSFYQNLRQIDLQFAVLDPAEPSTDHQEGVARVKKLCERLHLMGDMPSSDSVHKSPSKFDKRLVQGET